MYTKQKKLLLCAIIAAYFISWVSQQSVATPIDYWVFKSPYQNPIVPGANFLGYWLPPQDNPGKPFIADGATYKFTIDAGHPKGPFFATDPKTGAPIHDGIDLFAWLEKVDGVCKIHLFKTTDVVKPTTGGMIDPDGFQKGPDGVARIIHPPKPLNTYEKYAHVDFQVNGGDNVTKSTNLGTLSNLGADSFVHLHYSVYVDGEAKDPLSFMEKKQTTCIPEPSALLLFGIGALGFIGYGWRRWRQNRKEK